MWGDPVVADILDGARERKGWGVTREEQGKEGDERAYNANADPRWPANSRGLPSCDTSV